MAKPLKESMMYAERMRQKSMEQKKMAMDRGGAASATVEEIMRYEEARHHSERAEREMHEKELMRRAIDDATKHYAEAALMGISGAVPTTTTGFLGYSTYSPGEITSVVVTPGGPPGAYWYTPEPKKEVPYVPDTVSLEEHEEALSRIIELEAIIAEKDEIIEALSVELDSDEFIQLDEPQNDGWITWNPLETRECPGHLEDKIVAVRLRGGQIWDEKNARPGNFWEWHKLGLAHDAEIVAYKVIR